MNLSDMQAEWRKDSVINAGNLAHESLRTAILHSKYIDMFVSAKKLLSDYKKEYNEERKIMAKYYRGEFTKEELAERNLEQYQYSKPLKAEMEDILKSDSFIVTKYEKVEYLETTLEFLESVLSQIKSRDFQIKNSIQISIFMNGG